MLELDSFGTLDGWQGLLIVFIRAADKKEMKEACLSEGIESRSLRSEVERSTSWAAATAIVVLKCLVLL